MKVLMVLGVAAALTGCASSPVSDRPRFLFADHWFPPPAEEVSGASVFALSEPMRAYLGSVIAERVLAAGPRHGLLDALQTDVRIEYEASRTRTAAESFEARAGNCLSLVVLTAAFARELGVPVRYQAVLGHDAWTRSGGFVFHSGHVNIVLGYLASETRPGDAPRRPTVVDFLPPQDIGLQRTRTIDEDTVVAMYLNNRAAEILADGETDRAYWWARAAIETSPSFLASYNTLGVIYQRHGRLPEAERALAYALEREPENVNVLSNLSLVFARQGRTAEADALLARRASIEPHPPFHYLDQGLLAMKRGDNAGALVLLRKELARMPYDAEVHYAVALASLRLGDLRRAQKHMKRALENSPTRERQDIYAAKLEFLESRPTIH